jgi:CRISPR-associated protein Cmr4
MNSALLGLLAETPIHPGCGRSMGVVDLPVAREAATDYPVIVGSSLKGALRDKAKAVIPAAVDGRFGSPDQAGDLLVADARLLLLPVRSLTGSYRWTTCPHLLERFRRDLARAGLTSLPPAVSLERGSALTQGSGHLFLEERQFRIKAAPDAALVSAIQPLLAHEASRQRLAAQIAVLHDDDFAWFARYGLAIQARNVLEEGGTKKSVGLWYEETLPPDTLMYTLVLGRQADSIASLQTLFPAEAAYLQAGGNETVGQGWFAVTVQLAGGGQQPGGAQPGGKQ